MFHTQHLKIFHHKLPKLQNCIPTAKIFRFGIFQSVIWSNLKDVASSTTTVLAPSRWHSIAVLKIIFILFMKEIQLDKILKAVLRKVILFILNQESTYRSPQGPAPTTRILISWDTLFPPYILFYTLIFLFWKSLSLLNSENNYRSV